MREVHVRNAPHPALVDDTDYELVADKKWALLPKGMSAIHFFQDPATGKTRSVLMHRLILQPPARMVVDHIDHDALNNQRANMRICTQQENVRNSRKRRGSYSSRFKGVFRDRRRGHIRASITVDGKDIYLGRFDDEIAAALAYNEAAIAHFGAFASINDLSAAVAS